MKRLLGGSLVAGGLIGLLLSGSSIREEPSLVVEPVRQKQTVQAPFEPITFGSKPLSLTSLETSFSPLPVTFTPLHVRTVPVRDSYSSSYGAYSSLQFTPPSSLEQTLDGHINPSESSFAPVTLFSSGTVLTSNIFQTNGLTRIDYTIVNQNSTGTIFNSATLDIGAMYAQVFSHIISKGQYNSVADMVSANKIAIGIDPGSAEELVNRGWELNLNPNTGILHFSNNGLDPEIDYNVWRTQADGNPNTFKLTVNLSDLLDDASQPQGYVELRKDDTTIHQGFEGIIDPFNSVYANTPSYSVALADPGDISAQSSFSQLPDAHTTFSLSISNGLTGKTGSSAGFQLLTALEPLLSYIVSHNVALQEAGVTTPLEALHQGYVSISAPSLAGWEHAIDAQGNLIFTPGSSAVIWQNQQAGEPHTLDVLVTLGTTNPALNPDSDPRLTRLLDLNANGTLDPYEIVVVNDSPDVTPLANFVATDSTLVSKPLVAYEIESPCFSANVIAQSELHQANGETPYITLTLENQLSGVKVTQVRQDILDTAEPVLSYIVHNNSALASRQITSVMELLSSGLIRAELAPQSAQYVSANWEVSLDPVTHDIVATAQSEADYVVSSLDGEPHSIALRLYLGTSDSTLNPQSERDITSLLDLNKDGLVNPNEIIGVHENPNSSPSLVFSTNVGDEYESPMLAYTPLQPEFSAQTDLFEDVLQPNGQPTQLRVRITNANSYITFSELQAEVFSQIQPVLSYIAQRNGAVSALSHTPESLFASGLVRVVVDESAGNVSGWSAQKQAGTVVISPQVGADVWQHTPPTTLEYRIILGSSDAEDNPTLDARLSDLLDLNGNQFKDAYEQIGVVANPSTTPFATIANTGAQPISKALSAYEPSNTNISQEVVVQTQFTQHNGATPTLITQITNAYSGLAIESAVIDLEAKIGTILQNAFAYNPTLRENGLDTFQKLYEAGIVSIDLHNATGWQVAVLGNSLSFVSTQGADAWNTNTTFGYTIAFGTTNPLYNPSGDAALVSLFDYNKDGVVNSYELVTTQGSSSLAQFETNGITVSGQMPQLIMAEPLNFPEYTEEDAANRLYGGTHITIHDQNNVKLQAHALPGMKYTVETSYTLAPDSWTPLDHTTHCYEEGQIQAIVPRTANRQFYRWNINKQE
jgi:hypothetical protein